jgi:hypothetical protein
MSVYRGFSAAAQAATAVNARRAALAAEASLDHQLAAHDAAERRRERLEGLRQILFESAKVVREAGTVLQITPAASYYYARQVAPIFGPGGVSDADLPDLADKRFHHETATARASVETAAARVLGRDATADIDRIVWLDAVLPALRRYAALRALQSLARRNHFSYAAIKRTAFGSMLKWALAAFAFAALCSLLSTTLATIVAWVGCPLAAYGGYRDWQASNRLAAAWPEAAAIAAAGGEPFTKDTTDQMLAERATELRSALAQRGCGADLLDADDSRPAVDQLSLERGIRWDRTFGRQTDAVSDEEWPELSS